MKGWGLLLLLLCVGTQAGQFYPHFTTLDDQEILQRVYQSTDSHVLLHHALSKAEWVLVLISPQEKLPSHGRINQFLVSQVEATNSAITQLKKQLASQSWPLSGLDPNAVGLLILQSGAEVQKLRNHLLISRGDSGTVILLHSTFATTQAGIPLASLGDHLIQNPVCRSAFVGESYWHYFQYCLAFYQHQQPFVPQYSLQAAQEAMLFASAAVVFLPSESLSEEDREQVASAVRLWSPLQKEFPHHMVQFLQLEEGLDWHDLLLDEEGVPLEDLVGFVYGLGAGPIVPVQSSTLLKLNDFVISDLRDTRVNYVGSFNIRDLLDGSNLVFVLIIDPTQQNHQEILRSFKQAEASRKGSERKKKHIRFLWTDNAHLIPAMTNQPMPELPSLLALRDQHIYNLALGAQPTKSDILRMTQEYQLSPLNVDLDTNHPNYGLMATPFATSEGREMNHLVVLYQPVCGSCNLLRHGILKKLKALVSQVPELSGALRIYEWNLKEIPFPPHLMQLLSYYPLTEVPAVVLFPGSGSVHSQHDSHTLNILPFSRTETEPDGTATTRHALIYQDVLSLSGLLNLLQHHLRLSNIAENVSVDSLLTFGEMTPKTPKINT